MSQVPLLKLKLKNFLLLLKPASLLQWKQVIFEDNEVTGISPISGGQSLGTGPGGGRAQHVFHAKNRLGQ